MAAQSNTVAGHGLHAPPITKDILQQTAALGGVRVPDKWEDDFTVMLSGVREAMEQILGQEGSLFTITGSMISQRTSLRPDFVLSPDLERFPRKDMSRPTPDENPYNAWAIKVTVENINKEEKKRKKEGEEG